MPCRSSRPELFVGISVGTGQCVALLEQVARTPNTHHWHRSKRVRGNLDIAPGTAIATFDPGGSHGNHVDGGSRAAIYLGQDAHGIQVIDQWVDHPKHQEPRPHHAAVRTLPFDAIHRPSADNRDEFYVID